MEFQPVFEANVDDVLSSTTYHDSLKAFQAKSAEIKKKEQELKNKNNDNKAESSSILNKSFVADNGIRYVWDAEDQDWIEADDDYDDKDEFSDEDGDVVSSKKRGINEVDDNLNDSKPETRKRKRKNKNKNKAQAHWVYITGLPHDVTAEELNEHFSKVGIIAMNPYDQTKKIKIYRDSDGNVKGDGSICYVCLDSVKMAIDILHEGYLRPNCMVTVTKAEFNVPTAAGPADVSANSAAVHKRPQLTKAQISIANNATKQALSWNDEDDAGVKRSSALKIVVLQGMFHPTEIYGQQYACDELDDVDDTLNKNAEVLIRELEEDIVSECTEKCSGRIEKITIFSKHPKGIIVIKFATAYAADECIKLMDGRWYNKTKLRCYYWDGTTNYNIDGLGHTTTHNANNSSIGATSDDDRLDTFGDWLENEQQELPEEFRLKVAD